MTKNEALQLVRTYTKDHFDVTEGMLSKDVMGAIPGMTYHQICAAIKSLYGIAPHPGEDGAWFPGVILRPTEEIDQILSKDRKVKAGKGKLKPTLEDNLRKLVTPSPNAQIPADLLFKAFYRKVSAKRLQAAMLELFDVSPVKAPLGTQAYQLVYPGYDLIATSLEAIPAIDFE